MGFGVYLDVRTGLTVGYSVDGIILGSADGVTEGVVDGVIVGAVDGVILRGELVFAFMGIEVGCLESLVGRFVAIVGTGAADGIILGSADGVTEGTVDGVTLGSADGVIVGADLVLMTAVEGVTVGSEFGVLVTGVDGFLLV